MERIDRLIQVAWILMPIYVVLAIIGTWAAWILAIPILILAAYLYIMYQIDMYYYTWWLMVWKAAEHELRQLEKQKRK